MDFRDAGAAEEGGDVAPEVGDGDEVERDGDALERRVAALEAENAGLRELADSRAGRLEALEGDERQSCNAASVDVARRCAGDEHGDNQGQDTDRDCRPPRRRPGMPDAGVVTLEELPDEEHAFGPAPELVAEWRRLRVGGNKPASRVERAQARVRRWELEVEMLRDWLLTLPPETEAQAEAQRELSRAKRARLLRRLLTLGVWRTSFV